MRGAIDCKFDDLVYKKDGNLLISFKVAKEHRFIAERLAEEYSEKNLSINIFEHKSKRSIEQNRLMWALLTKLTEALNGTSSEDEVWDTYKSMLSVIGAKYIDLLIVPEAESELKKAFRAVKDMGERQINGKTLKAFRCYEGSSHFTTKEMTEFIEAILNKLSELGIYDEEVEKWREAYGIEV